MQEVLADAARRRGDAPERDACGDNARARKAVGEIAVDHAADDPDLVDRLTAAIDGIDGTAVAQHGDAVGDARDLVQFVRDQDRGDALRAERKQALEQGRIALGVDPERCFTDAARAFEATQADFCTVVVTPEHHERIVDLALAHDLDILCEKPIAVTMAASLRIARKVASAGRRMAVTMSHRFDADKTTLRRFVRSGVLGRINAIGMRFQGDMRQHMAWSSLFRHRMADPLLIEGSIHHFDILADLAGARCETLYASTWKPAWAEYAGDTDAVVSMTFAN